MKQKQKQPAHPGIFRATKGGSVKEKPILPPACKWDFRQVDPNLFREAAVYEYARSSEKIRAPLVRWLDTVLKRKKIRQHILDAIRAAEKHNGDPADFYPAGLWKEIYLSAPELGISGLEIGSIIMQARPDFPSPWITDGVKIRGERDTEFSRVRCYPLEHTFNCLAQRDGGKIGLKKILEIESRIAKQWGDYKLQIDWFADGELSNIQDVVRDFEKWLRGEVKRTKPKMRAGRNAQAEQAAYPLKCLAALRLRRAGFTYDAAANALQSLDNANWIIPYFKNPPSWTKAIQFAKKTLAEFEAGKINF